MRVAIIGAGAAGLAALRHCVNVENNDFENPEQSTKLITVICYEKSDQIGGTWVYTPETGVDNYGIPIHSSMYNSLRANLPKEVMGFPDFPIPENSKSYLSRREILDFLNSYCDYFQLRQFIQFRHHVEFVEPISTGDGKWAVRVKDLKNNKVTTNVFDAIMICNGHYFEPNTVSIEGSEVFKGSQMHSHDYRIPEVFSGKRIVVFGAGPSGMDLALEISRTADRVILSHHTKDPILTKFPDNVLQKTDLVRLTENEAIFMDGSKETVDVIFYCTGYKYSFPFLSDRCEVRVKSNMVTPLWKHLISIENPSLAFIGLPFYVCAFSMFDLQVRFVLQYWLSKKELPSKKDMLDDESEELKKRYSQGLTKRQFHMMGPDQGPYYQDLAETAGITPLPQVLTKLHNESSMRFLDDLVNYREDRYAIIDDWNFVKL